MIHHKLPNPLILNPIHGLPCKGTKVDGPVTLWRWATPRALNPPKASLNLTKRSKDDLPTQVRFEQHTNPKLKIVNPIFIEWIMGFPENWTHPDKDAGKLYSWDKEPNIERMVKESTYFKQRSKALGNACVPACSKKAFEILTQRFKKRKRDMKEM